MCRKTTRNSRLEMLDELQARVVAGINSQFLGQTLPCLLRMSIKANGAGVLHRTRLVFFEDTADWRGKIAEV